ncbi:sortase [Candidatus Dojkabacteria bacterium]|nr:sortase [Candidatus Dojkabacteria bacterium]
MSLYSYKKAPVKKRKKKNFKKHYKSKVVLQLQQEPLTLWKLLKGLSNDIKEILTTSRFAGAIIPTIFIIYGIYLLSIQIIPTIQEKLQKNLGYFNQGHTSLVAPNYVAAKQQYLSNPGSKYFEQLQTNAFQTNVIQEDPTSNNYRGTFRISIPDLGLHDIRVQANVNSGIEEVYDKILEKGLAHMETTGLPISDVNNNIVIYGHSAGGSYFQRSGDHAAAFSILNKIKIGNKIQIVIEGKTYNYQVTKTKIVKPYDVSIITGNNPYVQTLTLFTCYPAGNNAQRLVVTANPV